jgi:hypothetical protein
MAGQSIDLTTIPPSGLIVNKPTEARLKHLLLLASQIKMIKDHFLLRNHKDV